MPVTAEIAVDRLQQMVRLPIRISYPASLALGFLTFGISLKALTLWPIAFVGCWLNWSYLMPHWRRWAAERGVDPARLQEVGERENMLWPKGSMLEKTEFR